ncbi:hypothetical protein BDZ91DRAFT_798271 [Kalaharituber pfeilii]|nr:hypothetical protein BDZ91DRAFT_798271 [Kalaharituber pfeilii]
MKVFAQFELNWHRQVEPERKHVVAEVGHTEENDSYAVLGMTLALWIRSATRLAVLMDRRLVGIKMNRASQELTWCSAMKNEVEYEEDMIQRA